MPPAAEWLCCFSYAEMTTVLCLIVFSFNYSIDLLQNGFFVDRIAVIFSNLVFSVGDVYLLINIKATISFYINATNKSIDVFW
jgi:hypothetical protein